MRISSGASVAMIAGAAMLLAAHAAQGRAPAAAPQAAAALAPPPAFAQCRACHNVAKGGPSGVGPNLFGSFGAAAGAKPGYSYSPAMKASRIRWDRARLDAYLADPKAVVPGTKMMSPPVKDAARRKEIVDFLAKLK